MDDRRWIQRLKAWAAVLKRDVFALWLVTRDARVPLVAKLVAGVVAAYALSPIDLIPDFIPVLGLLDDLILVPAGIWLAVRLIPPLVLDDLRAQAMTKDRPVSRVGFALVIAAWLTIAAVVWRFA